MHGQILSRPLGNGEHLICGILHTSGDQVLPEMLYRCTLSPNGTSLTFDLNPHLPQKVIGQQSVAFIQAMSLSELMMLQLVTVLKDPIGSMLIYTRATTAPAPDGMRVVMFCGLLHQGDDEPLIKAELMHDFNIDPYTSEMIIIPSHCNRADEILSCRGNSPDKLFRSPIWGHDPEPWGFNALLPPEVIYALDYLALLTVREVVDGPGSLSEAEQSDAEWLNGNEKYERLAGRKSPVVTYPIDMNFARKTVDIYGYNGFAKFAGVSTQVQLEAIHERVAIALAS